jgi:hypothetical protein
MIALGMFILVAGTYGVIQQIINAYADGTIGMSRARVHRLRGSLLMVAIV